MGNKVNNPSNKIKLPKLKLHGAWKKVYDWISHFQHLFWIICIVIVLLFFTFLTPGHIWRGFWLCLKAQGHLIGMVLFLCFAALLFVWAIGRPFDLWVFKLFNKQGRRPFWLDRAMLGITQLGNFIFALFLASVLYFGGYRMLAYELIMGVLTLGLVVQFMKTVIHRTRPYNRLKDIRIVGDRDGGHSFPSGHTSQAFFIASILLHYYQVNLIVWIALYATALLVGITRIYVGMHYPRDVMGGATLGTTWGIVGVIINNYFLGYFGIQ